MAFLRPGSGAKLPVRTFSGRRHAICQLRLFALLRKKGEGKRGFWNISECGCVCYGSAEIASLKELQTMEVFE